MHWDKRMAKLVHLNIFVIDIYDSTPEGRDAEGKHAQWVGCLDIMWREFISQCKDLVFCPPYLWGKIDSQLLLPMGKCRHHLILQDLI